MPNKPCKDHLGNEYPSISKMLEKYKLSNSTFYGRMRNGWTLEQALTIPHDDTLPKIVTAGKPIKDHLGNWYPNVPAMCKQYGITDKQYWSRKRILKWSLKKILTTPLQDQKMPKNAKPITCNGIQFKSISALCRHYDIPKSTFKLRLKQGYTPEEAVKIKPQEVKSFANKDTTCIDPWGNKFKSQSAMYKHYGTNKNIVAGRLKHGWTLEQILLNPEKIDFHKPCIGPDGKEYAGFKIMAEAFNLTESALRGRLIQGYTLYEATIGWDEHKEITDHLGNQFTSKTDMYSYWNTNVTTMSNRLKHHSLKESLETIHTKCKYDDISIIKKIDKNYYEIELNNSYYVFSKEQIWQYFHNNHKNLILNTNTNN